MNASFFAHTVYGKINFARSEYDLLVIFQQYCPQEKISLCDQLQVEEMIISNTDLSEKKIMVIVILYNFLLDKTITILLCLLLTKPT